MTEPTMVFKVAESLFEDTIPIGLQCAFKGDEKPITYTLANKNVNFSFVKKPYKELPSGLSTVSLCSVTMCFARCPFYYRNWHPERTRGITCMLSTIRDRSDESVQSWLDFVRRLANE